MIEKKLGKMSEIAYILGQIILSLGVCLTSKAGFGVSMVVSPAYVLHLSLVKILPWYTFGTSEYVLQGVLLLLMCIAVRKFKWQYLLSFVSAVIYGLLLDGWMLLFGSEQYTELHVRIISFVIGVLITGLSIALFFRTYLPVEVYELVVSELASTYRWKQVLVKWIYDFSSLILAVVLTLCINGDLTGVGIGALICAVVNAPIITVCGKLLDKFFSFEPIFPRAERFLRGKEAA